MGYLTQKFYLGVTLRLLGGTLCNKNQYITQRNTEKAQRTTEKISFLQFLLRCINE